MLKNSEKVRNYPKKWENPEKFVKCPKTLEKSLQC